MEFVFSIQNTLNIINKLRPKDKLIDSVKKQYTFYVSLTYKILIK